jgi:hypothetical protein
VSSGAPRAAFAAAAAATATGGLLVARGLVSLGPGSRTPAHIPAAATGAFVAVAWLLLLLRLRLRLRLLLRGAVLVGFPNLRVAEGGPVLQRRLVRLVLHVGVRWQLQNLFDRVADLVDEVAVGGGAVPDAQNVFGVANGQNGAANFAVGDGGKLAADQREDDLFPVPARQALGHADDPFPALGVAGLRIIIIMYIIVTHISREQEER